MNRAKAYLENREAAHAIEASLKAVALDSHSAPALRNLTRAYLLARNSDEAVNAAGRALGLNEASAASQYLLGLAHARESRFKQAIPFLEQAVRLDPQTAALRYQLAVALQAIELPDRAEDQFKATIRIDPLHASAHFKLAAFARRTGDADALERHTTEYVRLRRILGDETRTADALEACTYTQPEPADPVDARRPSALARDVHFVNETSRAIGSDLALRTAVPVSVNERGDDSLLAVHVDGRVGTLRWGDEGTFSFSASRTPVEIQDGSLRCIVGDYHNDVPTGESYDASVHARNDAFCFGASGGVLLKQIGDGAFRDAPGAVLPSAAAIRDAHWAD